MIKRIITFSLILCIITLNFGRFIYVNAFEATTSDEIGYLDFENSRSYNKSDTIEVYNERPAYSELTDADGNNLLRISLADTATNQVTTLSYGVTRIAFDKLPIDKDYYISWDFCLYSGGNVVFNPWVFAKSGETKDTSVGVIRIQDNGLVSAKNGWNIPTANDGSTLQVSNIKNTWHNIEGVREHNSNKFIWYLDGKKVAEYSYNANGEVGYMYIQTDKGSGSIGDTLMDIDNISTGLSDGNFAAVTELSGNDNLAVLRFNRFPKIVPAASEIAFSDEAGNTVSVTDVKQKGNTLECKLSAPLTGGKRYTINFGSGVSDRIGRKLKSMTADVKPVDFTVSAEPENLGGIFDDTEITKINVTVKKAGISVFNFVMSAKAYNSEKEVVWQDETEQSIIGLSKTKTISVYPKIYDNKSRYGLFELEVTVKKVGDDTGCTVIVPFSQIMSNNVLSYKMGTSTHYTERYQNTDDISGQIALNAKAGMGIDRDDVSWHSYDSEPLHTLKGRLLQFYQGAKSADMIPMGVMTHGVWKYDIGNSSGGRFAGIAKYENLQGATDAQIAEKEAKAAQQLEKFGEYINAFAKETASYAVHSYSDVTDGNFMEIGNEWDLGYYYQTYIDRNGKQQRFGVQPYVDILKTAWQAVQDIQNRPKIVGVVSAVAKKSTYLKVMGEYLDAGAAEYCDAISLHPYYWTESPEDYDICGLIDDTNKLFDERNISRKPLILSEWGSSSALVHNKNRQKQAAQAVRGMALVGTMTDSVIWYTGQEKNYDDSVIEEKLGLIKSGKDSDFGGLNFSAKPVYGAIACYNSLTADTNQKMWQKDSNGTYICEYTNDNKKVVMVWNPDKTESVSFSRESGYSISVYDMYGNRTVKTGFLPVNVTASENPLYVVYTKTDTESDTKIESTSLKPNFETGSGATASDFSDNGGSFVIDITSGFNKKIGTAIVAAYSDGRLVKLETTDIKSNNSGKQRVEIPVPSFNKDENVDEFKAFVWEDLSALTPACKTVTIMK